MDLYGDRGTHLPRLRRSQVWRLRAHYRPEGEAGIHGLTKSYNVGPPWSPQIAKLVNITPI